MRKDNNKISDPLLKLLEEVDARGSTNGGSIQVRILLENIDNLGKLADYIRRKGVALEMRNLEHSQICPGILVSLPYELIREVANLSYVSGIEPNDGKRIIVPF